MKKQVSHQTPQKRERQRERETKSYVFIFLIVNDDSPFGKLLRFESFLVWKAVLNELRDPLAEGSRVFNFVSLEVRHVKLLARHAVCC